MSDYLKAGRGAMKKVATQIIGQLSRDGLWNNVKIYTEKKIFESEPVEQDEEIKNMYRIQFFIRPRTNETILPNRVNPKTLTIQFGDGPLSKKLHSTEALDYLYFISEKLLHKYGLYLEMVDAYTITANHF